MAAARPLHGRHTTVTWPPLRTRILILTLTLTYDCAGSIYLCWRKLRASASLPKRKVSVSAGTQTAEERNTQVSHAPRENVTIRLLHLTAHVAAA